MEFTHKMTEIYSIIDEQKAFQLVSQRICKYLYVRNDRWEGLTLNYSL